MINRLRIVLSYMKCSDDADRKYANLLALAFCDSLPSDFKGPISGSVARFKAAVSGVNKGGEAEPGMVQGLREMKQAVLGSWVELKKMKMPQKKSKWYVDDIGYQSLMLVKAFVDGFKVLSNKLNADIPALKDLEKITDGSIEDQDNRVLHNKAYDKFRMIPLFDKQEDDVPKSGPPGDKQDDVPGPGDKQEPEKVVPDEKGKAEFIQKDVKDTIKELGKNVGWFSSQVKKMPLNKQQSLKSLMDKVLDIMTAPATPATVKTAGLDDGLTLLVRYIHPVLKQFTSRLRDEKVEVPNDDYVWRDPDRLRATLEDMEPDHLQRVLTQVEKILGMLAY